MLAVRTYVPEQYAGVGTYVLKQNKYLIATHGIASCVGVSFYCSALQRGAVIHLDSDHKNKQHLDNYFYQILGLMNVKSNKVIATVVLSNSYHECLDVNVLEVLEKIKLNSSINIEMRIEETRTVACLALNLANGEICTNYQEKQPIVNDLLAQTLNFSNNFQLYHLRNGNIYKQPRDKLYQVVTNENKNTIPFTVPINGMIPQDDEAVRLMQQHQQSLIPRTDLSNKHRV